MTSTLTNAGWLARRLAPGAACLLLAACGGGERHADSVARSFGDDFFSAGGVLNVTEPVNGDAFLAGGHVSIVTEVRGDLVAAGGELSVGGNVGDDLYAAGGEVRVDAIVQGNARVAGGDVTLGPATSIAGGASLTGGSVDFEGDVQKYLQASGGKVRLAGTVRGDVEVRSQDLVIAPGTEVSGRLVYHGPTAPVVPEDATIAGGVEFHESGAGHYFDRAAAEPARDVTHGAGSVLWFVGVFLVAALFTGLFPGFSSRAAALIGRDPLKALGLGLAVLVCVPFVAIVLMITVIGIPLALLLAPLYLILLFVGWVVAASFLAGKGLEAFRRGQVHTRAWRLGALFGALLLLALLRQIPFVGGLIAFVALLAGLGAVVWQAWSRREPGPAPA